MGEIQIVNPTEFGIEKTKAEELMGSLPQIIEERKVLVEQFDEVIKLDIEDPETTQRARELRLLIQKNRTQGINVWHKTNKDYFLKGGNFVDAIKRKEVAVNERMEGDLAEIEKHAEIKEQKRLEALQAERVKKLEPYVEDADERDLSGMDADVWEAYFSSKKKEHDDRVEAEKKAEEERIAKEKAEAEERARIAKENEQLKKEAEERERKAKAEEEKRKKEEEARLKKEEEERKAREEKERKEREAHEAELQKEREDRERIEREEREKREKLEAELKAKEEAEHKAKEEEEARKQAELSKGDEEKVQDFIKDLSELKTKYSYESKKYKKMYEDAGVLLGKIIDHVTAQ